MDNIKATVKGDKLLLEIDLKADLGPSASGKTNVIASSRGNQSVPGHPNIKMGVNVYSKPE